MATSFDTIEELGLTTIVDYRLDNLYNSDIDGFQTYIDGILIRAISYFPECWQDLSYDAETRTFESDLTFIEQSILADWYVYVWLLIQTQDITQFRLHLQKGSFKTFSEAEALKQRSEYLDRLREKIKQAITDYDIVNLSSLPYFGDL